MSVDGSTGSVSFPIGTMQTAWTSDRARSDCCDLGAPIGDSRTVYLSYADVGTLSSSADAAADLAALLALYASTDPATLDTGDAGSFEYQVEDSSYYDGGGFHPLAELSAADAGPGLAAGTSGSPNGEYPLLNSDYTPALDSDVTRACGNFFKAAQRFRIPLDPPWRTIDGSASIKVDYHLASRTWTKTGHTWSTSDSFTAGSTATATIAAPSVGATFALGTDWIAVEGSEGVQTILVVERAYVDRACVGD
jgi:hypothetical protein